MAIKWYYMPLTNCIVIKVVILCDDDDVAFRIFNPAQIRRRFGWQFYIILGFPVCE